MDRFEKLLKNAGFENADIIEEWHELFLTQQLFWTVQAQTIYRIFNSEKCKIEFKNMLLVAELAFCLPVSTEKLKRSFSILKRIKRDTRAALGVN